jgi:hypothetical protein
MYAEQEKVSLDQSLSSLHAHEISQHSSSLASVSGLSPSPVTSLVMLQKALVASIPQ